MRFSVIGGSGLIGSHFNKEKYLKNREWSFTYNNNKVNSELFSKVDANNKEELHNYLEKYSPDVIILTAALPNVNLCEKDEKLSYQNNVELVKNVIEYSKKSNVKLVFYSSDYVFDGKKPFQTEEDLPNPINVYGKHKLESEKNIIKSGIPHLIIRTAGVYGLEKNRKNFLYRVYDNLKKGNELKLPNDMYSNSIFVEDLVDITMKLIEKNENGIFHLVNSTYTSRYELSLLYAIHLGLNHEKILGCESSEFESLAPRPKYGGLSNSKIISMGFEFTNIKDSLEKISKGLI
jgi:dTDP-4-dehydrorhamnose reductase